MKIICSKEALSLGVSIALKAVPAKTTMPILECLVLRVSGSRISLLANDMEMGIETEIQGEIVTPGSLAVNARIFSEIIRKLPENQVTIESDDAYNVEIHCEKAKFNLAGKGAEEFPALPEIEKEQQIVLSQFSLKEMIRQTVFSISDNDSTRIMTGELFEVKGDVLRVISLDGHRISIRKIQLKESYPEIKVIVPGKTLVEISKIIGGDLEKNVTISFTGKHVVFEFQETMVVSRLIEGNYYKVDQMLSQDYETRVTVNRQAFLNGLDRATLLVKETEKKPIILNITDVGMELTIRSALGAMKEEVPVEKEGKDLVIGFNPRFLMDALRAIDEENIQIFLFNPKAPCFIKDKDESYLYLILPVNFSGAV